MKFVKFIIFIFILIVHVQAQNDNMVFLKYPFSAKSASMGGLGSILPQDASLVYENPASLYGCPKSAGIFYVNHLLDFNGAFAYFAMPYTFSFMRNQGYLAVFIIDMNYGEIDGVDEYGNPLNQKFGANDFALGVSYSSLLNKNLIYGVTTKIAYSSIASYSSSALFVDFSLHYQIPSIYELALNINVKNAGVFLTTYSEYNQSLPFSVEIGFTKKLRYLPLRLGMAFIDFYKGNKENIKYADRWKIGAEFQIHPKVMLRLGYNQIMHSSLSATSGTQFAGTTFGAGIHIRNIRFDAGWIYWGDVGMISQFGFNYMF